MISTYNNYSFVYFIISCAAGFKLKIISFVEETNNWATFWQFRVYEKLIRDWLKNKAKIENIIELKKDLRHGKSPFLELENV